MQDIKDIEAALEELGDWWYVADMDADVVEGIDGIVTAVEQKGGVGQGEYCHIILMIQTGEKFRHFKKVGCHVSHDGTYWDGDFTEVQPVQKTITVWE